MSFFKMALAAVGGYVVSEAFHKIAFAVIVRESVVTEDPECIDVLNKYVKNGERIHSIITGQKPADVRIANVVDTRFYEVHEKEADELRKGSNEFSSR